MGNLISSIQHNKHNLVIAIFLAVVTVVMVILPFYKPSIHPNPSSKQEAQIKKDATSSANVLGVSQTDSANQKAELKPKQSNSPTANPTSPSTYTQTSQNNKNNNAPGQQSTSQSTSPVVNYINIIVPTQTPTAMPIPILSPTSTPAPTQTQLSTPTLDNLTRAQVQAQIDSIRGGQNIKLADLKPPMSVWLNTFNLSQGYPLSKDFMVNHILDDLQNYQGVIQ